LGTKAHTGSIACKIRGALRNLGTKVARTCDPKLRDILDKNFRKILDMGKR
jgi:hypothetical protein